METNGKRERVCLYPGSFDPITVGHMDIIRRAATLFDRVVVAVLHNPAKKGCFSVEERLVFIRRCCAGMENVTVGTFDGLTVEYARQQGACAMVRGLRSARDFDQEQVLAQMNRRLMPEVDTVFLTCDPAHSIVSSSGVRELASFGGNIEGYVPNEIEHDVLAHFAGRKE